MQGNVLIIAEAGVNHNGSLSMARKLIDAAVEAGADCVKFQTFKSAAVVSNSAVKAAYQRSTTDEKESQLEMIKKLELRDEDFYALSTYCKEKKIVFLSTPFDLDSVDLLTNIGLDCFKIPSGEITNLPYLKKIGSLKKKLIVSTGMSTIDEIAQAIEILVKTGTKREDIALLHCTTEYPAPYEDVNLRAMRTMAENFPGLVIGYSDHTRGIEISIAAVAMGARIIEKHFTLSRTLEGPDHQASLEPKELAAMVQGIRNVEAAMGDGNKCPMPSELPNRDVARKSLVSALPIKKGDILTEAHLTTKRPGTGLSPMLWEQVLGIIAPADLPEDALIPLEWIKTQ